MPTDITIATLRGGMNDELAPSALPPDQCVLAENVEFFLSTLGERRGGCAAFSMTGSGLLNETTGVFLGQWFPDNDPLDPDLWGVGVTPGTSATFSHYQSNAWTDVTPDDAMTTTAPGIYGVAAQALNAKWFLSYPCSTDRLHVWDGTHLRRTGLAQPAAAPVVTDTGSGTYATTRYFQVRYVVKSGATVLLRSEPSAVATFTPSGSGSGALITKPATINEHETHWEIEASTDNAFFYRIATVAVGTTTYTDTTTFVDGYNSQGPLSETIGTYLLQPNAKYLTADDDRLIGAGHRTDPTQKSRVWWSPVNKDPGVGNDERLPLASLVDNYEDLDTTDGGEITGLSQTTNGLIYLFKFGHIYRLVRTFKGSGAAYKAICDTKKKGALDGSVLQGMDEYGRACVYFLDPVAGPCRIGQSGINELRGLRNTWKTVNIKATDKICMGVYYPDKQQLWYWVARNGQNTPNYILKLQVNEVQETVAGVARGWAVASGRITEGTACCLYNEVVTSGSVITLRARPLVYLSAPDYIQRCDTGEDDHGHPYAGTIITRPYLVQGLLNNWGEMACALLATADATASVEVACIRDFGQETNSRSTDLLPQSTEEFVIKTFDDLVMSEARSIQFRFSDG